MKKSLLTVLSLLVLSTSINTTFAKSGANNNVLKGIELYKAGNYTACYEYMTEFVKVDPSNALAYYYLAMSASQVGRREEAIDNYDKVLSLTSLTSNLGRYANKGKICLEKPDACKLVTMDANTGDGFIMSKLGPKLSDEVKTQLETLKREELRRDINRDENIERSRFKEFKDFSSMNNTDVTPSNDEIVAALRVLQKAGFSNVMNNNYSDISMLTGMGQHSSMLNMMGANSSMSPQVIQALLTNNMSQGF